MAIVNFTLSEDGVAALRDALFCLNKFADDVSLEAKKDKMVLTALNSSKSAYASFTFVTAKFCSRYKYEGDAQHKDRYYCTLYIRALLSIFRSRLGGDPQRDREKEHIVDHCDVAIEDGFGIKSRFVAKLTFRNGLTSTHRLPFEVQVPVHAKFHQEEAVHHWTILSRTLRQLMDHFGPGLEYLDINSDGEHVNFTGFAEKRADDEEVLKKPLHTSIAVEVEEFEDIEVEDKLHVIVSVKDFKAILQHASIVGNPLSARYSAPAKPIQLKYQGDGMNCEFLLMTIGERGTVGQKTKNGRQTNGASAPPQQQLEAASRRTSAAPSEAPQPPRPQPRQSIQPPSSATLRANLARISHFDLRPSQRPPPPSMHSEGLFVDNDQDWEPVNDPDEDAEENAVLEWDHSDQPNQPSMRLNGDTGQDNGDPSPTPASSLGLEPTQRLSDVRRLGLFYRGPE